MKIIKGTVLAGVGAAVLLLSAFGSGGATAAPTSVDGSRAAGTTIPVTIVTAMREDGTVDYQVAQFVRSAPNNTRVEPVDGIVHTAVLTADAEFLSTTGCNTEAPLPPSLDQQGLGTRPCDRASYSAMTPSWIYYAPAIFFNDAGEIVKMANHYRP